MRDTRYQFNVDEKLAQVNAYKKLTSSVIVVLFTSCILLAIGFWLLFLFREDSNLFLSLAVLLFSGGGGLLLVFVYGGTYYPYLDAKSDTAFLSGQSENGQSVNVADAFSFDLVRKAGRAVSKKDLKAVWASLLSQREIVDLLHRLQLSAETISETVETVLLPSLTMDKYSRMLLEVALAENQPHIATEHALGAFLLQPEMQAYIREHDLTEKDVLFAIWWSVTMRQHQEQTRRWWDKSNLLSFSGIGLSWASGYTVFVDRFAYMPGGNLWDLPYGHESQVEQLIGALARERQSNVLIVGQPGVGRLGVVKEVSRRVKTNQAHPALRGQRVVYIHLGELLALGGSGPEQLSVISRALREMEHAGNVIAVLDGMGSILGGAGEDRVNLTDVLLPFFSSQSVRVAVIMAQDEYNSRIKSNAELLRFFDIVQVPPLSPEATLQLLAITAHIWERKSGVYLPYATLKEIVDNTSSILPQIPFPEKAFDVLEEVIVVAQGRGKSVIEKSDVNDLIANKVGVNVGRIKEGERGHLLQLDEVIHRRVINQSQAVSAVSRAMIRSRAGVRSQDKPIGTFLFLGPTGVGKTETSKALAEAYFGSEDYIQRLDMSEFQGQDGVARLIGSLEYPVGRLTSMIGDNPFTVLLLDEFEKADRSVQQLFLQVFDEGHISDAQGRIYMFNHAIIIATSNAGAEFIRSTVQTGNLPPDFDEQVREYILKQDIFRPELLNRFDGVITFTPLSEEHIRQVADLMMRKLNKRLDDRHGIKVSVTEELVDYLVEIGYDPEFGARPMARAIKNTVEYAVAEQIIKGQTHPGQAVVLSVEALRRLG